MKQAWIIIGLVIIFVIGLWHQFYGFTPLPEPPERQLEVQLAGAINQPGVYTIEASARLGQLIELAGGLTEQADEARLNLAQKLIDGEKIVIPQKVSLSPGEAPEVSPVVSQLPRDSVFWQAIPGIGPATAGRIIDYLEAHPEAQLEDLSNVSGIGPKKLQQMRDFFEKQP